MYITHTGKRSNKPPAGHDKIRKPEPPVVGTCPSCDTDFPSRYSRKTHRCSGKQK